MMTKYKPLLIRLTILLILRKRMAGRFQVDLLSSVIHDLMYDPMIGLEGVQVLVSSTDYWPESGFFRVNPGQFHAALKRNQLVVGPVNDMNGAFHILYPLVGGHGKSHDQR